MSSRAVSLASMLFLVAFCSIVLADDPAIEESTSTPPRAGWEARIEKALESDFAFRGTDVPLVDFAKQVSKKAGITVLLDERSLDDVGIRTDAPVTCDLKGISLRSMMRHVLREQRLTYVFRDGALIITTPGDAYSELHTEFYDVTDLAIVTSPVESGRYECDELIRLITSTVAPTCWSTVGGPGRITACRGQLLVSQTRDVHESIRTFLSMMRKAKQLSRTYGTRTPPMVSISELDDDPVVERIRKALRQPISVDFQRDSLAHVAAKLSELLGINVAIDVPALDDVGIGMNVPVTFRTQYMRTDFVLRHILRELDLTFAIRHQAVLITTPEGSSSELATRMYPGGDLLGPIRGRDFFGDPLRPTTVTELTRTITATVAPRSWDRVGGPATIAHYANGDFLVIIQYEDVHEEIGQTLTRFRASLEDATANSEVEAQAGEEPARLRIYSVRVPLEEQTDSSRKGVAEPTAFGGTETPLTHDHTVVATDGSSSQRGTEQLLQIVGDLLESAGGSEREDVYVRAIPGRLVIRHTAHVHRQIERLLKELRVLEEVAQPQP